MRGDRIAVYTGTTDSFSATTSGGFAAPAQGRRASSDQSAVATGPAPTSVILVEGDAATAQPAATPAAISEAATPAATQQVSAQVLMSSSLYAFPGPSEADVWLTSQEQTLGRETRTDTKYEQVTEGPSFGDASATFSVSQPL